MYDRIASGQPNKDKISERRYAAEKPENALDNDVQVFYRKNKWKLIASIIIFNLFYTGMEKGRPKCQKSNSTSGKQYYEFPGLGG